MPASLLTEILFRGAIEVVLYGLGYAIGWVVVPVLSFGYYRVEPWDLKPRSRTRGRSGPRRPKQVSADAACAIGLVALAAAVALGYFAWRAAGT